MDRYRHPPVHGHGAKRNAIVGFYRQPVFPSPSRLVSDRVRFLKDRYGGNRFHQDERDHAVGALLIFGIGRMTSRAPSALDRTGSRSISAPQPAIPISLRRRGHELRLVHGASHSKAKECDDGLIRLLAASRRAWEELQHKAALLDATRRSHLTRLARLHFLAPDIITAILDGRQPVELTSRALLRIADLPLDWSGQRQALGFI
jgi:hypothetical protein